ncbi:hypothetical protein NSZ01_40480 [Nocardioides szechwanensis]|uniref:Sulfotransferase family protein n=1 Tax=Nocardioides szechwanensis TaxID=1005944 RepID=A0A1H0M1M4_9ACTN|nr:hypothetical protein [Nocardioides szechwanensis]GEP36280.1 hypothetical protein NSZ01_40480 [Nocardioides szechwanensis]SDO74106.1 hypothetical protein SAMN05192576_0369 [Nocardioides szechwanensis]
MTTRPLFVHVGASKTGTSALQAGLWSSKRFLRRSGVGLPFVGRPAHVRRLLRPLGWTMGSGFDRPVRAKALRELAPRLRDTPGDRLLISNEDLCELDEPRIDLMRELAAAADLDLRVVVTARDWAKQLPSEWQQFLKHRLTTDYPTFLDQVRRREGAAAQHFWQRQDISGICARWGAGLDPSNVHVIAVPPMSADADGVFRLFGGVVGFDASRLTLPTHHVNASFGYVEAEVLRRLNESLGERLADYEKDYVPAVRNILVRGVLAREASAKITLPPEHLGWVRELADVQLEALRAGDYRLYGDPELLLPGEDAARALPELDEAQVAAAAVETLAAFATRVHERRRSRLARQQAKRGKA